MRPLVDAWLRALAYCFHPRVILLSLLPLALMVALALGLGYFFWEPALQTVRGWLESWALLNQLWSWLQGIGLGGVKVVLAPLIVIYGVTPLLVLFCLLLVSLLMTPALTRLVAARRFPALERRHGASTPVAVAWSVGSTLLALVALLVTLPFWLIPPLVLLLPALIWGWLTYRVMAFDCLAEHASADERRAIFVQHRSGLLAMGVVCGFMGAAPGVVWASAAVFAAAFVILLPLAVWLYTLVFVFSSLWFAHYCLAALQQLREQTPSSDAAGQTPPESSDVLPSSHDPRPSS
jgi:hypothetical protein